MENSRPSPRQVLLSILFTTGVAALVVGVIAAIGILTDTLRDPASSGSDGAAAVILGILVYGPTLLVNAWPLTLPVIVAVGVGLAFMRRRIRIPKWVEIAFMAYGGIFLVVAVTMVLAAD
jgi:hypothetical protein